MNAPAVDPAPVRAAQALARHLRENPSSLSRPPKDLADEFGLRADLVADVVSGLRAPASTTSGRSSQVSGAVRSAWTLLFLAVRWLTSNPLVFAAATTMLGLALLIGLYARPAREGSSAAWVFEAPMWAPLQVAGIVLLLHLAVYARHGSAKAALHGALLMWALNVPSVVALTALFRPSGQAIGPTFVLQMSLGLLMASAVYGMFAVLASLVGRYARLRRLERATELLSRQELLQRLFELRGKLTDAPLAIPSRHLVPPRVRQLFLRAPYLWAVLVGFTISFANVWVLTLAGFELRRTTAAPPLPIIALQVVMFLAIVVTRVGMAYLARTPLRALAVSALAYLGSLCAQIIPTGQFGPEILREAMSVPSLVNGAVLVLLFAVLGGLAAEVEARGRRERLLKSEDPDAVLAEIVRIEWRLAQGASEVCIVVVDAARSAEMKATGDALDAEFSFREYQFLLGRIADSHRGEVHSTAGDGAVLAFARADDAFEAAREIQTRIERFNQDVNRLSMPFRLRIGIHMGEVPGELDAVRFTHVIDVAAHVQGRAPIGGILATQAVASRLIGEPFAPMAEPVDGQPVLLALQPTVDA